MSEAAYGFRVDTTFREMDFIDCYKCGMVFAVPRQWNKNKIDNHETFYCPNGHTQHYTGKSKAEKLRIRLEEAERQKRSLQGRLETSKRSHSATKGQLTKTKNRIMNGVCPCCNRSFVNLAKHMRGQHPGYEG